MPRSKAAGWLARGVHSEHLVRLRETTEEMVVEKWDNRRIQLTQLAQAGGRERERERERESQAKLCHVV